MTKQEKAEFIAKKVLGYKFNEFENIWFDSHNKPLWNPGGGSYVRVIANFICSPEGLIAVVTEVAKRIEGHETKLKIGVAWDDFFYDQDYEALYNTVIEVFGEE